MRLIDNEDIIKALCIISAGFRNEDEKALYQESVRLINDTADYIHLVYKKEKIEAQLFVLNQNK